MATTASRTAPRSIVQAAPAEPPAPTALSRRPRLWVLLVLLLLTGAGAAAWFLAARDQAGADKPVPPVPPVFVVLEPFTVNLQESSGEYLHLALTLQVADAGQADQFKMHLPQLRSRILLLLSSQNSAQISGAEGKKKLATEVAALARQPFTPQGAPHKVSDVFFTSFVIQ